MTYISPKTLTFEDFISQYQDNPRYELADGELIDMEPTGPHETVSGKLATQIGIYNHHYCIDFCSRYTT
ncbi:Uma2 family endonuclease [Nostoc sp.]|uniref:Uma2 family endonuclease n=1 Tax=Nostoc sp. TaxID=1180 RepID=UPI002FFB0C71